jgi:biotin carboxylase
MDTAQGERYVVIVDGYSTGSELTGEFAAHGVRAVHVQSSQLISRFYTQTHARTRYAAELLHDGDVEATAAAIAGWAPLAVIPGTESGVMLADALCEELGLPGNGTALSEARRDKVMMAEAVGAHGLRCADQCKSGDPEVLVGWAVARGEWPVVVKPVASAGTDSVYFCATPAAVGRAAHEIRGRRNKMGWPNDEVMAQGLLRGDQYFVNSVSWDGVHHISEIWHERKQTVSGASVIADTERLLPGAGPVQARISTYVGGVLDALGIRFGAAHTEVMLCDGDPVLIETAARLQGSLSRHAIRRSLGTDQVSLTVEAYLDPETLRRRASAPYEVRQAALGVWLISREWGLVDAAPGMDAVRRLPSFCAALEKVGAGDTLEPTVDLFTSPGLVYLVHEDTETIERDYQAIRELEEQGFFAMRPVAATS